MTTDIAPRFLRTPDAIAYLGLSRTRFYRFVGELKIKPAHATGNASLWRRSDIDRLGDHLEGVERADAAA